MNSLSRAGLALDQAMRAVHAAEREWVVAYVTDGAENTPESDVATREARAKVSAAKLAYAEALKAFDALRDTLHGNH